MRSMMLRSVFLMISIGVLFAAISAQAPVEVHFGKAVTIDGTIADAEWADASAFDLTNGGRLLLKHDGTYLYVGVRGTAKGWCHIYVARDSRVEVLHASAALGRVIYKPDEKRLWQSSDSYTWELRDRTVNDETRMKMDRYLAANGWVAGNSNMGEGVDMEFKIVRASGAVSIAVVHTADGKAMSFFPEKLADDTLKRELVRGEVPAGLTFDPAKWARLEIQEIKNK